MKELCLWAAGAFGMQWYAVCHFVPVLTADLDTWAALSLVGTSAATSFVSASFGLGGGAILLAVMALLLPPAALIPVHGVVQLGSNAGRTALLLPHVFRAAVPAFAAGSVLGAVVGGAISVELPGAALQMLVGLFVLFTVVARAPGWLTGAPAVTGMITSFLTMFVGASGLFVAGYSRALNLPKLGYVATHAALMTLQHGLKVAVFAALGFAFSDWLLLALAMMAAGLIGTWAGRALLIKADEKLFRRALDVLLVALSLRLIWQSVT